MSRVTPIDVLTPEVAECYAHISQTRGHVSDIMKCFGHSPNGLRAFSNFGEYVRYQTGIAPRARELIILSVARGNTYAWLHHYQPAIKAGLNETEIKAIEEGSIPASLSASERAAAEYALALTHGDVGDAVFESLRTHWTDKEVVDITLMVGYYLALGTAIVGFNLDLEPDYVRLQETLK